MGLLDVVKEYAIQEKQRRSNIENSIVVMQEHFWKMGIKEDDYCFKMNIKGDFHGLDLRKGYYRLELSETKRIIKQMESTGCRSDSCHPMFYHSRVCVAFTFFSLEKMCALAEKLECARSTNDHEKIFYTIGSDIIVFFRYLPKDLHKEIA